MSSVLQASLESTLRHEPLAAVPVLFAAGLATSLTPCVYPMIPITAGILGGAGASGISRGRTAVLTAAYVAGLALVYALLGLLAGLTGSLFGTCPAALQSAERCSVICASSSILLVASTCCFVGSSTASMRRMTHIGRMTSGYLPRLKRSRRTSSAMPQMKETILLCVA